jgi:hypothetical protein
MEKEIEEKNEILEIIEKLKEEIGENKAPLIMYGLVKKNIGDELFERYKEFIKEEVGIPSSQNYAKKIKEGIFAPSIGPESFNFDNWRIRFWQIAIIVLCVIVVLGGSYWVYQKRTKATKVSPMIKTDQTLPIIIPTQAEKEVQIADKQKGEKKEIVAKAKKKLKTTAAKATVTKKKGGNTKKKGRKETKKAVLSASPHIPMPVAPAFKSPFSRNIKVIMPSPPAKKRNVMIYIPN